MSQPVTTTLWSPCRAFRHRPVLLPPTRSFNSSISKLRRQYVAHCCHSGSAEPANGFLPQSRFQPERGALAFIRPVLQRIWILLGCAAAAFAAFLASSPSAHAAEEDGAFQAGVAAMTPEEAAEAGRNPRHRPKSVWVALNDPIGTMSNDLRDAPKSAEEAINKHGIVTSWRTERLHDISYTQFLILLREGHIEKVRYKDNMKAVVVTTKPSCPGRGQQTHEVGLIYDPDLYNLLCAHGVAIEYGSSGKMAGIQAGILRMFGPVLVTVMVVAWSLTLGRSPDSDDPLFGGARMELIRSGEVQTTFDDVAGIDDIKEQVMEVVSFLQDQETYLELGARAPAGVLLCGPPGVGKTLLAKAIAGQAGVPFYNSSGADFSNMFVGVGAARVRDMFERARKNAPCVLFIDEFDGVGQARSAASSASEENVQTINQLLTELDGFEDNTGVVVLAATNRPSALDEALTRPGRFDRIITIPYPNLRGRLDILDVHARDKPLDTDVNMHRVARATAGFSGADLMNLMNQSAVEAVRRQAEMVTEDDIFTALEKIHTEKAGGGGMQDLASTDEGAVTPLIRRTIATYMAAKALVGLATPDYDDLQRIVVTPENAPTGYVYFIPQDAHLETEIVTRSFMEGHMVVSMAGRVAEVAVMGAANMTTAGAADLEQASDLARDMVFKCGWSLTLGPVNLGDDDDADMLGGGGEQRLGDMSPMMASAGLGDMAQMMRSAEAKAYFALVMNWELLEAMVNKLMTNEPHALSRLEIEVLCDQYGVVKFEDTFLSGFEFDEDNRLMWPPAYDYMIEDADDISSGRRNATPIVSKASYSQRPDVHPLNPYQPDNMYIPMDQEMLETSDAYFKPEAWWPLLEEEVREKEKAKAKEEEKEAAAASSMF